MNDRDERAQNLQEEKDEAGIQIAIGKDIGRHEVAAARHILEEHQTGM